MQRLLRRKKGKLSLEAKLKMGLATATGMTHLHQENILHNVRTPHTRTHGTHAGFDLISEYGSCLCSYLQDLATRNLLVMKWQDGYDVKVSDFGRHTPSLIESSSSRRREVIVHIPVFLGQAFPRSCKRASAPSPVRSSTNALPTLYPHTRHDRLIYHSSSLRGQVDGTRGPAPDRPQVLHEIGIVNFFNFFSLQQSFIY